MFDVSFSELLVIAVVALLVIGPEKLPKVARTVGAFVGRMQRYMAQVKEEVNREMRFEELQKLQQEIKQSVESAEADIKNLAKTPKQKTSKPTSTSSKPKAKTSIPKRVKSVTK
jgi:sec-independent protein translocase protein TatB